ncbi:MAG: ribosomal protein S18-alanine N-acetyltransferase [Clostridiaceae bacterium]|nr:ribosomal protein S18-alanine N-acetyltransferase [Clostridiaceae bacterium]
MSEQTQPVLRRAEPADSRRLAELDQQCFAIPWSEASFANDLADPERAYYLVWEDEGVLVGYGGYWRVLGEGEIMNIAVAPNWRRRGLAAGLLPELIRQAEQEQLSCLTLEVRESNLAARALYSGFGFVETGMRRNYYADNNENAIIMLKNIH